jgi:hypothetical protein
MDESLEAQLQATLDMIPAFTWYAAPSGALLFVNSRFADYLGLRPRIAKRDRAVGDPVGYRRIHRGRELVIH